MVSSGCTLVMTGLGLYTKKAAVGAVPAGDPKVISSSFPT